MQRFTYMVEVEVGNAFDANVSNAILAGTDFDKDGNVEHAVEVAIGAAIEQVLTDFGGMVVRMMPLRDYTPE